MDSTITTDSSTEEEDDDVDAVVLQLHPQQSHAPAPSADAPASAGPGVLAFAESPSGVLVPKERRPERRSQAVFKLGDYVSERFHFEALNVC